MDDGRVIFRSRHIDRHLLGIRAEIVKRINGSLTIRYGIIQVTIYRIILQLLIVSIGIRAVTATIYITINGGIDTDGIATSHLTCYIVTAIDVVHMTTQNARSG